MLKEKMVIYKTRLPGNTNMTLCGDPHVIKQILEMINGKFVKLKRKGWSQNEVEKINTNK